MSKEPEVRLGALLLFWFLGWECNELFPNHISSLGPLKEYRAWGR